MTGKRFKPFEWCVHCLAVRRDDSDKDLSPELEPLNQESWLVTFVLQGAES